MKPKDLEQKMRRGEWFHSLRVPEGMWFVVRLDGRGFTQLVKEMNFKNPFDEMFHSHMLNAVTSCMLDFQNVFATTHSDEISLLFRSDTELFDREVEKIVSSTAAKASVSFSACLGYEATFDSRIWIGADIQSTVDYFCWRLQDSLRSSINSWAYWTLRQNGFSPTKSTSFLKGKDFSYKNEMLMTEYGINFNDVPAWQKRGTGLYFTLVEKTGYNPIKDEKVHTLRRVLHHEETLPMKENFRDWLTTNLRLITGITDLRNTFTCDVGQWNNNVGEEVQTHDT